MNTKMPSSLYEQLSREEKKNYERSIASFWLCAFPRLKKVPRTNNLHKNLAVETWFGQKGWISTCTPPEEASSNVNMGNQIASTEVDV